MTESQMTTDMFSLVVITIQSFPHSWLIYGFVTRVTRWGPHVEQERLTLLENLSSPYVFSGVRVTQSSVFCVMFYRSLFVFFLLAIVLSVLCLASLNFSCSFLYPPPRSKSCRGVYWFHHVRPTVCRQILCHTITWVVFLRNF